MAAGAKEMLLGESLLQAGNITQDQLQIGLIEQSRQDRPLGDLLVSLGFLDEGALQQQLAQQHGIPPLTDTDWQAKLGSQPFPPQPFPRAVAERYRMLYWQDSNGHNQLATAHTKPNQVLQEALKHGIQQPIALWLATASSIRAGHERVYPASNTVAAMRWQVREDGVGGEASGTAVDLVDELLQLAIRAQASDIHLQPEQYFVRVRLRRDGQLVTLRELHKTAWPSLLVRIKLLAELNITESRLPQDGRMRYELNGHSVDMRLSTQPTLYGENLVIRLLDRPNHLLDIGALGFESHLAAQLRQFAQHPQGLIVISGPTGSGKTTTLYALLQGLDSRRCNIMTLEDPVEAVLGGIRQTPIREEIGFGFADGIRALMRQDPDVIMVGEIRDEATAHMALRAALTGHLVLTTLHSHDSLGIVSRLLDFGVAPGLLAESWRAGLAQRLLRRLCPDCAAPQPITHAAIDCYHQAQLTPPDRLSLPTGCPACDHSGYRGRLAVGELLPISATLSDLIASGANRQLLRQQALQDGQRTLRQQGLTLAATGQTSLAEVERWLPSFDNPAAQAPPLRTTAWAA
jgi:general secretion pathway protein E/type IV pilus assembly protein PilB